MSLSLTTTTIIIHNFGRNSTICQQFDIRAVTRTIGFSQSIQVLLHLSFGCWPGLFWQCARTARPTDEWLCCILNDVRKVRWRGNNAVVRINYYLSRPLDFHIFPQFLPSWKKIRVVVVGKSV